jgi:hypothetical protein
MGGRNPHANSDKSVRRFNRRRHTVHCNCRSEGPRAHADARGAGCEPRWRSSRRGNTWQRDHSWRSEDDHCTWQSARQVHYRSFEHARCGVDITRRRAPHDDAGPFAEKDNNNQRNDEHRGGNIDDTGIDVVIGHDEHWRRYNQHRIDRKHGRHDRHQSSRAENQLEAAAERESPEDAALGHDARKRIGGLQEPGTVSRRAARVSEPQYPVRRFEDGDDRNPGHHCRNASAGIDVWRKHDHTGLHNRHSAFHDRQRLLDDGHDDESRPGHSQAASIG